MFEMVEKLAAIKSPKKDQGLEEYLKIEFRM